MHVYVSQNFSSATGRVGEVVDVRISIISPVLERSVQ